MRRDRSPRQRLLIMGGWGGLAFSCFIAALAFANGRFLDGALETDGPRSLPAVTTLAGTVRVFVSSLVGYVVVLAVLVALVLLQQRRSDRGDRRRDAGPVTFALSGFASEAAYEARRPDWESPAYAVRDDAVAAAIDWLVGAGQGAVVEQLRLVGDTGRVERVLRAKGTEPIGG